MRGREEEEENAEVSMSPLIDCVFLLLIFFLVSTMMKKQDKDIDINLPESESEEKMLPTDDQIVIGIDKDGVVYYEGQEASLTQLHSELRHFSMNQPQTQIRLDADAESPLHSVVQVVDLCQFNNLNDVVIRTYDEHYNKR